MSQDLQCLINKLTGIQQQLGGPLDTLKKKDGDEFNRIKLILAETVNFITKKQEEKDSKGGKAGRTVNVIRSEVEIRDKLQEAEQQLEQMQEALRRQRKHPKKYPAQQIEIKEKQLENCKNMVRHLKNKEEGIVTEQEKPVTLTEMKIKLHGNPQTHQNLVTDNTELDVSEIDALQRFAKKDKELDAIIIQIDEGLGTLRNKAEMMGEKIDEQEGAIKGLDEEVVKTAAMLDNANTRLKKILFEYRKPSKFCMDVVLALLLLGLIGVVVKLAKS